MGAHEQGYGGEDPSEMFSMFRLYAIGRIAADLPFGQRMTEVYLDERLPSVSTPMTDEYHTLMGVSQTASGRAELSKTKASVTTRCQWLALESDNRITPPDVCEGERVLVYRLADTDQYYWVTMGDDTKLRKLETVIIRLSATPSNKEPKNNTNCYVLIADTRTGLIMLTTSMANGEASAWMFRLDLMESQFVINDGLGDTLNWFAKNSALIYKNAQDSSVAVIGKNVVSSCSGSLKASANDVEISAPAGTTIESNVTIDGDLRVKGKITADGAIKGQTVSNAVTTLVS